MTLMNNMVQPTTSIDVNHEYKTVTFAANGTISTPLETGDKHVTAIFMPAAWTASGGITFLAATTSSGTYGPVYDDNGVEAKVTAPANGAAGIRIPLVSNAVAMERLTGSYIELRSGTNGSEVAQVAERVITVELQR